MTFARLVILSPMVLVACSQPASQSVPTARNAPAASAEPAQAEPATASTPEQAGNLYRIAAIARACAQRRPGALIGQSGSRLVLDKYYLIEEAKEGTWRVTFTEEAPTARPYGRSFEVDAARALCDGLKFASPAESAERSDADAVLAKARTCAQAKPFDGTGVCGSPLLLDTPTIHHSGQHAWVVSFPEESAKCAPRGLGSGDRCGRFAVRRRGHGLRVGSDRRCLRLRRKKLRRIVLDVSSGYMLREKTSMTNAT